MYCFEVCWSSKNETNTKIRQTKQKIYSNCQTKFKCIKNAPQILGIKLLYKLQIKLKLQKLEKLA